MANTILKVEDVKFSDWTFSNVRPNPNGSKSVYINCDNHRINIQTPKMRIPFGLQKNQWNEGDTPKYSLDLSFSSDANPKLDAFHTLMEGLDETVLKEAMEHPKDWFGKNKLSKELATELFTSVIRKYKDQETKEFTGKYPDTIKLKITKDGRYQTKCYGPDKQPVDMEEALKPGAQVIAIMQISQIWISTMGFGVSLIASQLKVFPPTRISGYCFLPDEDDEDVPPNEVDADGDVIMENGDDEEAEAPEEDAPEEAPAESEAPEEEATAPEEAPVEVSEARDVDAVNSDEAESEPAPKKRKQVVAKKTTSKFSKK